ncbi:MULTISPECIES: hypothetical protein [Pelosinus]|uniref:FG-GAP repeat protein n=1 Tax=Pelosinus fermentans B4 TaxID=1149862 RepID=I8RHN9_9FIRM|nr:MULTISPECIES: hypothetical protein [Pelosinus]EIW17445.1 hypothetical protein FB4_4194 [Pelosinus fermentans B4]EIW23505.1 hypothetical protein FA11_4197 [Pelosinus fermentans A11]OAM92000.1 hypothetical protein FR7_00014 [Pelosinus fermentans DSM 17108]SDQ30541.1 hypothetical protein SAMN04515679_0041 [Pelosinus fermentans]
MYKNYQLTAVLALGLMVAPLAGLAEANQIDYAAKSVYNYNGEIIGSTRGVDPVIARQWLPEGYQVLDMQEGDVNGDGVSDTVYLIGHKQEDSSSYVDSMKLIVENGADQKRTDVVLDKMGGYQAELLLRDFTGDKTVDALVTAASGGSGGWYYNQVVALGEKPSILFGEQENNGGSISGQFLDGFKVEINGGAGSGVTIDVHDRTADYLRLGLYNEEGKLQKQTKLMVTPFGRLEAVDANHDGIYELKGIQRISGAYNADGLANVETVLSYTGSFWQAQSVNLRINLHTKMLQSHT